MTISTLPNRADLKTHAKRLRHSMRGTGAGLTHSGALELIAQQWGYRDWNTLSAALPEGTETSPPWHIGQPVYGSYLGRSFTGRIKAISQRGTAHTRLTIVFDKPVDVVASDRFSSLRRQVSATINTEGRTVEKTSDGQPHLVVHAA